MNKLSFVTKTAFFVLLSLAFMLILAPTATEAKEPKNERHVVLKAVIEKNVLVITMAPDWTRKVLLDDVSVTSGEKPLDGTYVSLECLKKTASGFTCTKLAAHIYVKTDDQRSDWLETIRQAKELYFGTYLRPRDVLPIVKGY